MTDNIQLAKIALGNLKERRLRSWLTMIGIFIGITAVVALISLGEGLQDAVNNQFAGLGTDKLTISPIGITQGPPGGDTGTSKLYQHDVDIVKKIRGIKAVSYRLTRIKKVEFNGIVSYRLVVGLPSDLESKEISESAGFKVETGRRIRQGDKYKVMIGNDYVSDSNPFKKEVTLQDYIYIDDEKYDVVGIMDKMGNVFIDRAIVIDVDHAKDIFDIDEEVSLIVVQIEEGKDPEIMAEQIKRALRKDRGLEEGKEDFEVVIPAQLLETFGNVLNVIIYVIVGIAGISLAVGGVGIMNTMYTSILERRREIGIMKSIGARNSDISKIFVIESGLLGIIGGIIGVLLGFLLAFVMETLIAIAWMPGILVAKYPLWLPIAMMIFSFTLGTLFGTLPAINAAKLNPVDALRK